MQQKRPNNQDLVSLEGLTYIEKNVLKDYFVPGNSVAEISRLHSIPVSRARNIIMKYLYVSKRHMPDLEIMKADEILYPGVRHNSNLKKI